MRFGAQWRLQGPEARSELFGLFAEFAHQAVSSRRACESRLCYIRCKLYAERSWQRSRPPYKLIEPMYTSFGYDCIRGMARAVSDGSCWVCATKHHKALAPCGAIFPSDGWSLIAKVEPRRTDLVGLTHWHSGASDTIHLKGYMYAL